MSYFKFFAAAVAAATLALPAGACSCDFTPVATVTAGSETTKAFAGLNWAFGGGSAASEAVLGLVHGKPSVNNDLIGTKLAFYFGVGGSSGSGLKKVKLTRLWGDIYKHGELGFGYNFNSGSGFGVAGVNARNFSFGADFGLAGDFSGPGTVEGYIGIQSIGDFNEATTTWSSPGP
jgi:hypothetical protein